MATIITDATGLDNIRLNLSGDYVLGADIDLTSFTNWAPIGDSSTPFTGTLDFAGFSITGLVISRTTTNYVGLFGYCDFNDAAKIPNLKVGTISGSVAGQDYVGLLAGYIETTLGSTGEALIDPAIGTLVYDITGAGTVGGRSKVGGIIGMVKGPQFAGHTNKTNLSSAMVYSDWIARVEGLACSADVTGSGDGIGGLIGELYEITVNLSNATGIVTGGDKVGGIAGSGYRCAVLSSYSTGAVTGTKLVGGIIGFASYRPNIKYCYSEGNITGTGGTYPGQVNAQTAGVGGIAGFADLNFIAYCFALGDITAVYRAGGLIGSCSGGKYSSPNIHLCYARGDVEVSASQVGGLVGFMFAGIVEIDQCYCTGSVTGDLSGALIGVRGSYIEYGEEYALVDPNWDQVQGTVEYQSDCFYNSDVNSANNQYGGIAKTGTEMQLDTTYETSDDPWLQYEFFWVIDDDEGNLYPQLLIFYDPYGLAINLIRGSQGLTFSYLKAGELFYRQLSEGTWGAEVQVVEAENAQTLNTFRTIDDRIGWVISESGSLSYILTDSEAMTIDDIYNLTAGYYGDIIEGADEAIMLYVTTNGSMNQLAGDGGSWPVTFNDAKPIPSDSQVGRLRASIYGDFIYAVWRSRGQHRIMVFSVAASLPEIYNVRQGTITLEIDNPVVSVTLEIDEEVTV